MADLSEILRGLAAIKIDFAAKAPRLIAQADAAAEDVPVHAMMKAMVAAVCAGDHDNGIRFARRLLPDVPALTPLRLAPTTTLAAYCGAHGLPCTQVMPPRRVELAPSTPYSLPFVYDTEAVQFASLPEAQYIPGWDFAIGKDDTVLHDTGYMPLEVATRDFMTFYIESLSCLLHHAPDEEVYVDEDVLFLSAPSNSVGHWMIDFLPRLRGLVAFAGRKARVAIPAGAPARYLEMLAGFGIGEDNVVACAPGKRYRFKMCHVYKAGRAEPPNPKHLHFVRGGLTGGGSPVMRRGKRVFLGRRSIGTRMIANIDEFRDFLARQGFIAVDPADVDVAAQGALLSDAEIVLGPFGSNLFGMYFAPAGCHVITLINNPGIDPIIAPTAALLGMRHHYFICPAAPDPGLVRHKKDTDIIVDCAALAERLAEIG